eukprot:766899-Hanusia_phi.AAC.2
MAMRFGNLDARSVVVARAFFHAATKLSDDDEDILPQEDGADQKLSVYYLFSELFPEHVVSKDCNGLTAKTGLTRLQFNKLGYEIYVKEQSRRVPAPRAKPGNPGYGFRRARWRNAHDGGEDQGTMQETLQAIGLSKARCDYVRMRVDQFRIAWDQARRPSRPAGPGRPRGNSRGGRESADEPQYSNGFQPTLAVQSLSGRQVMDAAAWQYSASLAALRASIQPQPSNLVGSSSNVPLLTPVSIGLTSLATVLSSSSIPVAPAETYNWNSVANLQPNFWSVYNARPPLSLSAMESRSPLRPIPLREIFRPFPSAPNAEGETSASSVPSMKPSDLILPAPFSKDKLEQPSSDSTELNPQKRKHVHLESVHTSNSSSVLSAISPLVHVKNEGKGNLLSNFSNQVVVSGHDMEYDNQKKLRCSQTMPNLQDSPCSCSNPSPPNVQPFSLNSDECQQAGASSSNKASLTNLIE